MFNVQIGVHLTIQDYVAKYIYFNLFFDILRYDIFGNQLKALSVQETLHILCPNRGKIPEKRKADFSSTEKFAF